MGHIGLFVKFALAEVPSVPNKSFMTVSFGLNNRKREGSIGRGSTGVPGVLIRAVTTDSAGRSDVVRSLRRPCLRVQAHKLIREGHGCNSPIVLSCVHVSILIIIG